MRASATLYCWKLVSMSSFTRAVTAPLSRYLIGSAPCQLLGASMPFMFSSSGFASCQERGSAGIFGSEGASSGLMRSEEHTSELQSLAYLVCRLLLEKKKK